MARLEAKGVAAATAGMVPVQQRAVDVDPQQRLRAVAPQRRFAEHIVGLHGAVNRRRGHAALNA